MSAPVEKKKGLLASFAFPKPFWVINGVELFERGAYYGMLAVLSVFLVNDLGFPPSQAGLLLAIQFPLLYFLPVFAGALASKVGFKKLLIASFSLLILGYLVLSVAQSFMIGLLGVFLYGVGAGLFKPMPAATVSDTTSEEDRNFGFAIYYWMINLGAFLAPFGMAAAFGGSFRQYFLISAALSVLNLVICLTMWKDIRKPQPELRATDSIKRVVEIFQHRAFLVLLLIYAGFWFMYAITTSFLQVYAVEYGIMTLAQVALLVPANALAILIVGPIISKFTGKMPSLPLMIAGITVFASGFLLIGFIPNLAPILVFIPSVSLVLLLSGVFVYSIGEFLTHPSYLSYVTKISPPEKVPVFLGYGFIPIGIGQLLGTLSGGVMYEAFATGPDANPQMFWVGIVSVGMLTVAALLVYNYFLKPVTRDVAPGPAEPQRRRGFGAVGTFGLAILAILAVPTLLVAATMAPASDGPMESTADEGALDSAGLSTVAIDEITGTANEGETVEETVELPEGAGGPATFTLTWQDEAAAVPTGSNAPDTFRLHIMLPDGTVVESEPSDTGEIAVEIPNAVAGAYTIHVELVDAGDHSAVGVPLGLPVSPQPDTSNEFALNGEYQAAGAAA